MKLLNITQEIEQSLVNIFDLALKNGGMSVIAHIDSVRKAVQEVASPADVVPAIAPPIAPSAIES